jgi:hypothetical protein
MPKERYPFSRAQEEAIGQIMVDIWGSNTQSGFAAEPGGSGDPYIYTQKGPNLPLVRYEISPDGTVVRDFG